MAKVYFDTNVFSDLVGENKFGFDLMAIDNEIFASTLSIHILAYVLKVKIPNVRFKSLVEGITKIDFDNFILEKSLIGPTDDFEDNIQLHSAVLGGCDSFLTLDKKLLKMKSFGKVKICDKL
ncbi:MAG: type II toxin-antitoxin system VapC family toxin [Candidatus Shapirobacteria bacterium]